MKLSDVGLVNFGFTVVCLALVLRTSTAQDSTSTDYDGLQYISPEEWEQFLEYQKGQSPHTSTTQKWRYIPQEDDYVDDEYFDDDIYDYSSFDRPAVTQPQPHQTNPRLSDWFNLVCKQSACSTVFGDDPCSRIESGKCRCITLKDTGVPYVRQGRCGIPLSGYDIFGLTWRAETGAGLAVRPLTDDPVADPWPCCCNATYVSFGCCKDPTGIIHEPAQYQLPMTCGKPPEKTD